MTVAGIKKMDAFNAKLSCLYNGEYLKESFLPFVKDIFYIEIYIN